MHILKTHALDEELIQQVFRQVMAVTFICKPFFLVQFLFMLLSHIQCYTIVVFLLAARKQHSRKITLHPLVAQNCEVIVPLFVAVLFHLRQCTEQLTSAQRYVSLDERHADEVRCLHYCDISNQHVSC